MNIGEFASQLANDQERMNRYYEAIRTLQDIGFETVLRRIGEPSEFVLDHPHHMQMAAMEHAEKRGWFQALSFVFDFQEAIQETAKRDAVGDYGASEHLANMGYSVNE